MGSNTTESGDHRTRRDRVVTHTLIGFGIADMHAGQKIHYSTATDLVETSTAA
jgi:hypothetical protein